MPKPSASRVVSALLCGFCILLIAAWFSGSTREICETAAGHERCIAYNLAAFILLQIREALHSIEGIITALATIAIAMFTWTLWQSSEKMWEVTKLNADAADRSARAAIALQSPIIRIEPEGVGFEDGRIKEIAYEECLVDGVMLSNLGPTQAFPIEILYGFAVGEVLPEKPIYRYIGKFPPNFILNAEPRRQRLDLGFPLETGQRAKILGGNYLWFFCTLIYDDFMGERHAHGFCWRWANIGMGLAWRVVDRAAYNQKT